MKKASFLIAIAAFAAFPALAQNREIKFETGPFAEVLAKAKKENKPVMMDAYTTWCGPCKMMDKSVFVNDTVADYFNANFIPFKSDMEKGEGLELAKRYEVRAYPNFIFISPDGSVLHRSVGARPPKAFVEVGKAALDPKKQFAYYQKKYDGGDRNPEFVASYASLKDNLALDNSKELNDYFASQKDAALANRANWKMLSQFTRSSEAPYFKRMVAQRDAFSKAYTKDSVDMLIMQAYQPDLKKAVYKSETDKAAKLKAELTALNVKDANKLIWLVDAEGYKKKGDMNNYAATAAKLVDTYYAKDPDALNSYAWTFYEKVDDKKMLAKAENWSSQAVKMDPNYAYLDTQAAVLYKLGKKKEAKKAAENAIALGKKSGEDVADTEALLKKINELK